MSEGRGGEIHFQSQVAVYIDERYDPRVTLGQKDRRQESQIPCGVIEPNRKLVLILV